MARLKGSLDRVPYRKTRSDVGKKRLKYRGELIDRKKKKYKYVKKISDKQGLWLRAFFRQEMSKDGYKNWKPWLRGSLWKEITNMKMSPTFREVPFDLINTKDKFVDFFAERLWEGKFVIMGGSHGKTKTHFKCVPICTIVITKTHDGNIGKITKDSRLSKYKWLIKD